MPKKFFDIIPPQKKEPLPEEIDSEEPELKLEIKFPSKPPEKEEETTPTPSYNKIDLEKLERKEKKKKIKPRRFLLKGVVFISFCLVAVGITGYSIFSKTEVEIWPKTEIMDLKGAVTIDANATQSDFSAKVIPGKIFKDQKSGSQEFPATGKTSKEAKAQGVIKVYNAYSDLPQTLVANTRFVSADGKLFKLVKKEVVPGGTYDNGKLVPGSIDVEVQAAEAGEDYNIGPSTFSVPGLAGTPKYTAFYGKSFKPMSKGFKGEAAKITSSDIENAKNVLANKLKEESRNFLKNTTPKDFTLLDETISQEVTKENPSVGVNSEAKSFILQTEIKSEGLAFKKSDMDSFVKNIISSNMAKDKKFQEESLQIKFSAKNKESSKVVLDLEIRIKIYPNLDLTEIRKALSGKSLQEVKGFLSDQSQITKVEVKSSPFWRKKIPKNIEQLEVIINLGPLPI